MKRRWFQFHLSTAIVLMFVASGLLWLNMTPTEDSREETNSYFVPDFVTGDFRTLSRETWHYWGWPYAVCRQRLWTTVSTSKKVPAEIQPKRFHGPGPLETEWKFVLFNGVVALCVLFAVAFVCEWPVRRRERQQQNRKKILRKGAANGIREK